MNGRPGTRTVNQTLSNEARALLDAIAGTESPSYNTMYGMGTFDNYADKPRVGATIQSGPNKGKKSAAAGRYQFNNATWDAQKARLGLTDFSPENQDLAAYDLAKTTYEAQTGRNLDTDLASNDPATLAGVGQALSGRWTSLPGGIEQNKAYAAGPAAFAKALQDSARYYAAADQAAQPSALAHLAPPTADAADRLAEREADINGREPQSPVDRMWSGVQSVLGEGITQAMRAGNLAIGIGVGLGEQAAKIATNSAQAQNAPVDSPANRMRSAVGLPAHPVSATPDTAYSSAAPIGQVERGADLASPAARMHSAISQQYGGPTAAADAAKAQGISYSPNSSPTTSDTGPIAAATRSGYPAAPKESVPSVDARSLAGVPGPVTPQDMAGMPTAVTTPLGMDTSAPAAIADNKPDSLSFDSSMLANAPTLASMEPQAAPVTAPVAPAPAPKPVTQVQRPVTITPARPRTIQSVQPTLPRPAPLAGLDTAVAKARPGTSLFDAISQDRLGAAPQGTSWGVGVTGKPVAVANSAPEGTQIAASGTGILGALGLLGGQSGEQTASPGFFSGLANTIGGLFSGGGSSGGGYSPSNPVGFGNQLQANASNLASLVAANPYLSGGSGGGASGFGGGAKTSSPGGNLHG